MSKLSGDTLREGISTILAASQEKQRNFTETIELQVNALHCHRHPAPILDKLMSALPARCKLLQGSF